MDALRRIVLLAATAALLAPAAAQANTIESTGGPVAILTDAGAPWINPNAATAPQTGASSLYAETGKLQPGESTKRLIAGGFGFQIPATATITGLAVRAAIRDYPGFGNLAITASLIKAGTFSATKLLIDELYEWPAARLEGIGGEAELWGWQLTAEEVDSSTFGVTLQVEPTNHAQVINIDDLGVVVYYTLPLHPLRVRRAR